MWHKLGDYGTDLEPFHKSAVTDLNFVRKDLDRYEQHFQTKIIDLPTMGFFRMVHSHLYQTSERCAVLDAFDARP